MKIINFGSLNIDRVYAVSEFVTSGETILAKSFETYPGGKGLNQSIAAARAGAKVVHAGAIGPEGDFLADMLSASGVDAAKLLRLKSAGGHAVIQVNSVGQNSIIVYGGANQQLSNSYIEDMLALGEPGDFVLLQNETNSIAKIIRNAHSRGLRVVFNPSPFPEDCKSIPLELVDYFMINEIEGALLAGLDCSAPREEILTSLLEKYPNSAVVLTLGSSGVIYQHKGSRFAHDIYPVHAVDTTAAGDTFCGYFLSGLCKNKSVEQCLEEASAAAAIAVSRAGAAPSIPRYSEVSEFLLEWSKHS